MDKQTLLHITDFVLEQFSAVQLLIPASQPTCQRNKMVRRREEERVMLRIVGIATVGKMEWDNK